MASKAKGSSNMLWMLSTFLLIGILVGLGVSSLNGGSGQTSVPSAGDGGAPADTPTYDAPDADDDPMIGDADAPVTMIIFSDYECPYCQRYESLVYPEIKSNFIDTGLVNYVFRDFPLSFHAHAQGIAELTECAQDQGYFWEMHELITEKYEEWAEYEGDMIDLFADYAATLGASKDALMSCYDAGTYTEEVNADMTDGRAAGFNGTPSFFINGEKVVGALPYEDYTSKDGSLSEGFESILTRLVEEAS